MKAGKESESWKSQRVREREERASEAKRSVERMEGRGRQRKVERTEERTEAQRE